MTATPHVHLHTDLLTDQVRFKGGMKKLTTAIHKLGLCV